MRQSGGMMLTSLPYDIALKIASSLPECDVCSLGSCSRFWRELCESDVLWENLYRDRWALSSSSSAPIVETHSKVGRWKEIYKKKHNEIAYKATALIKLVEQCSPLESIEVADYLSAIRDLSSMKFEFKDVQRFLFQSKLNVLLNLIGLHYCISWLEVSVDQLVEALDRCQISDREVCARWWKLGRWFYGFRLRDESLSRQFSLRDLATTKGDEVLGVLRRGAIHEVLRVQISAGEPQSTTWSCQSTPSPT